MQRLNHDKYKCGYFSERELRFNHFATGVETLAPAILAMRFLLGNVSSSIEDEFAICFLTVISMGRAVWRFSNNYHARSMSDIEFDLDDSVRRNQLLQRKVCLFTSPQEVGSAQMRTRMSVGLMMAAVTMLFVFDSSGLNRSQESKAGAAVVAALIAGYELLLRDYENNYGAEIVKVDLASNQPAGPRI